MAIVAAPKLAPIPKNLGAAADMWWEVRNKRLALQKEVEKLEAEEARIKAHLTENLPKNDATGVAGHLVSVHLAPKVRVTVANWDALYAHIVKNYKKNPGVFGLLQRRVSDTAVKEIWESGGAIDGLKAEPYLSLSYSAIK